MTEEIVLNDRMKQQNCQQRTRKVIFEYSQLKHKKQSLFSVADSRSTNKKFPCLYESKQFIFTNT